TYPLTTAMLSVPKSRVVRGFSFFGVSFVYVIFADGTDLYWARSRVLEYLSSAARRLPSGVAPSLGPDATGVGWVYQYVVRGAQKSLADLRTIQDWYVRFGIAKAEGVAEVASVGGFVKQYSVIIDPRRLQALGIPLARIREALRTSNMDVGGRTVELAETEFAVRGRGYIKSLSDLEQIVLRSDRGVPVQLKDVARPSLQRPAEHRSSVRHIPPPTFGATATVFPAPRSASTRASAFASSYAISCWKTRPCTGMAYDCRTRWMACPA